MEMAGRGFSGSYRFGYQGSEKDNEVSGDGNSYTTEFRQLDPRLGRWFSVDPVFQPWQSPYTSMDNDPIGLNDPLGLDPDPENEGPMNDGGYTQGGDIGVIDDTSPLDGATHEDVENGNEINTPSNQANSQQNANTSNYYEALARQQDAFSENANIFLASNSSSSNPDPTEWMKHIWHSMTRGEKYLKKKIPRSLPRVISRQFRFGRNFNGFFIPLIAPATTTGAGSVNTTVGNMVNTNNSGQTLNAWVTQQAARPGFQNVFLELRLISTGDSDAGGLTTNITVTVNGIVYNSVDDGDGVEDIVLTGYGTSNIASVQATGGVQAANQVFAGNVITIQIIKTDPAGVQVDACEYYRVEVRAFAIFNP